MIRKIELENYRCYDKHKIEFDALTIAVGKNNAGKSTLIEALRLISLVTNKYQNLTYKSPPDEWSDFPISVRGVTPSLKGIEMSFRNIFNQYGSPPAKVTAYFQNKSKIELYIGEHKIIYAVIFDEKGRMIKNKSQAKKFQLTEINILPQIGPLKENEDLLDRDYIKSNIYSSFASVHFRNQLQYLNEHFEHFCSLTHSTWGNIKIREFQRGDKLKGEQPNLFIEDGAFVAEVGWMGHGLQMWLQTMWFLARCKRDSTVILDEPDVYLHADLQRKLIRFLKNRFTQTIIATHSIEIISEVNPENILVIDKGNHVSKYSTSLPSVQEIINNIGSIQNLELIRYWSSKKFIILESAQEDISILKIIQDKIFPNSDEPLDTIPKTYVEGWGGWQRVIGSKNALNCAGDISTYCIFDPDYHTEDEKNERLAEAKKEGINLHIWSKKEIENFLIVPSAIFRLIDNNHKKGKPTLELVNQKIETLLEEMKDDIIDCYSSEIHKKNKGLDIPTCNSKARKIVTLNWANTSNKLSIAPGKKMIRTLSNWSKNEFGTSFNMLQIARVLEIGEIDEELTDIISSIEKRGSF